jgi:N-dimethylarginine dimethylaminohydrolase
MAHIVPPRNNHLPLLQNKYVHKMTKNNFNKLKKVLVGDFPDHKLMLHHYETHSNKTMWSLYKKIADESKQDLDELSTFYKDHGVEVYRPKFDPYVANKWSKILFKPPISMSDRFFTYGNLNFYLTTSQDSSIIWTNFVRDSLEKLHDHGKYIFTNPLTIETGKMQGYADEDWPGDEGFSLDGPCFLPAEDTIIYNRKHCNTDRGLEWMQRIIKKFYPDTKFVDVSDRFTNHIDDQIRVYNENLASSNGNVDFVTTELRKSYPNIKVLDTSIYKIKKDEFKSKLYQKYGKYIQEVDWLKECIDLDDQNGNVDTSSVSVDNKTVVQTYNTLDLHEKLEDNGIKVEKLRLRHSKFWGAGMPCETAVLEREDTNS